MRNLNTPDFSGLFDSGRKKEIRAAAKAKKIPLVNSEIQRQALSSKAGSG